MKKSVHIAAVALMMGVTCSVHGADVVVKPSTGPTTSPTTQATTQPAVEVTPAAQRMLDRIDKAYAAPVVLKVEATVKGDFDVASRKRSYEMSLVGHTDGKGRFDHQVASVGRLVQTEDRVIVYDAVRNAFGALKQPPAVRAASAIPDAVSSVFIDENPSLLMAITTEPSKMLIDGAKRVDVEGSDLLIESDETRRTITLDDAGLIQSMQIDYSLLMRSRKAENIKQARVTLQYTKTERVESTSDAYAFTPPLSATEFPIQSELLQTKDKSRTISGDELKKMIKKVPTPATSESD